MRRATSHFPGSALRVCGRAYQNASDSGQSLIETALAVPFLLLIALNAINFAYYFFVAINLAASPRNGVEWSVQGFSTPSQLALPSSGYTSTSGAPQSTSQTTTCDRSKTDQSVSTLTYEDMTQVLPGPANPCPNIGSVQVCSKSVINNGSGTTCGGATCTGTNGASLVANCVYWDKSTSGTETAGSAAHWPVAPDPEAPNFVLHRVDVQYVVTPLIAGTVFGISLLPTFTFHRQVSMRAMD